MARFHKTPQPPIDLARRQTEGRSFWIGLVLAIVAAGVLVGGIVATNTVSWAGGDRTVSQTELVRVVTGNSVGRPTGNVATAPVSKPASGQADCPT